MSDILDEDLVSPQGEQGVVAWWESRRLTYNGVMLLAGLPGVIAWVRTLGPHDYLPVILMVLFGALLYSMAANACYTLGWVIELFLKHWLGKWLDVKILRQPMYVGGFAVSVLVTIVLGIVMPGMIFLGIDI